MCVYYLHYTVRYKAPPLSQNTKKRRAQRADEGRGKKATTHRHSICLGGALTPPSILDTQFHSEGRLGEVLRGLSAAGIAHRSSQEVVALLILGDRSVEEESSEGQHLTAHERGHQPAARATGRLRLLDLAAQLQQRA